MVITQTPFRLSLLGGNTDYPAYFKKHGGAVLTCTIDKYLYVIVKNRFDDMIYINYSEKEKVKNVDHIKHDLVREAMKLVGVDKGIEITFLSDIPSEGSGLGSSSAVTVGVLNALHQFKGESLSARQLAEEACRIEIDILKKPIGYQDQYAIAFGGTNLIEFGKEVFLTPTRFNDDKLLMLFYTGITRSADKILSKMRLNKKILDMNKYLAYEAYKQNKTLGELLEVYWYLKKQLNPSTTNKAIDQMYKIAVENGALGGKIVGAGGGGFLLLAVPIDKQDHLRKSLSAKELPFKLSRFGSRVIFNIHG